MKKFFYLLLPLFALTLTSCGDNEEDIPDPYEKTHYYLHYWFEPSADFSTYYDFTAKYVTLYGDTVTAVVTDKAPLNFEQTDAIKNVPNVNFGCIITATLKSGINVDSIADDLEADFLYKYEMQASKMDGRGEHYPFAMTTSKHLDPYTAEFVWELGAKGAPVKKFLSSYPTRNIVTFSDEAQ